MSFPRASALCAAAFGLLIAGCSSHAGNLVPNTPADSADVGQPTTQSTIAAAAVASSQTVRIEGPVSGVTSGHFIVHTTAGYVSVTTNAATKFVSGSARFASGVYALVTGTGSTSSGVTAAFVGSYTTSPATLLTKGVVGGQTPYGFTLKRDGDGLYVPVATTKSTTSTAALSAGAQIQITGRGTTAGGVFADSIVPAGSSTPTSAPNPTTATPAPSSVPKHLMTAEYFMGRYGTRSVTPATAARVLTWAQTSVADSDAISAAGIKTQVYEDPNRWATTEAMYAGSTESMFAHTCNGGRITSLYHGLTRYVTNPASTSLQSHYRTFVANQTAGHHVDAIFEDDAGPLSGYAPYTPFSPSMPCSYTDSAWVTGAMALDNAVGLPVITNGLNSLNGHNPSVMTTALAARNIMGGVYEHCYSDNSTTKVHSWAWTAIENTQLIALHDGKQFWCMARNTNAAYTQIDPRIWVLASFLMTYDPNKSVFFEEFGTASGLSVMPESKLVALNPTTPLPSTVDGLKTSTGTYAREFGACYIGGSAVGGCAVIVNDDSTVSHPNPFGTKYRHTIALSGNGILDGGTVSAAGGAPPSSIPPIKAYVVFK